MCGFIGLINTDIEKFRQKKEALSVVLKHRGPDNVSVFAADSRNIIMIHNRLSIIDLNEEANQPMIDSDNGNVIVFNGEIYNYVELKKEFKDIRWQTSSDTEVILKLYARLGTEAFSYLNGIFAFAIYDKAGDKIILCRDRLGVKPLYYLIEAGYLIFASEAKAILKLYPQAVNLHSVYEYLEYGELCQGEKTFFESVYSLPPAHIMEYSLGLKKGALKRYWDVPVEKKNMPEGEFLERVFCLLKDSMRLNMVSDVEVAISLSSGIDSASIFHLAKSYSGRLKAFTFGFKEAVYDEVSRVKASGMLFEVEHYPVTMVKNDLFKLLEEAIYYFETPLGGLGTLSSYNMMKTVRSKGIKVILSGEGSDEVFGGYRYYYPAFFKDLEHDKNLLSAELVEYNKRHSCDIQPFSQEYTKLLSALDDRRVYAPDGTAAPGSYTTDSLKSIYGTARPCEPAPRFDSHLKNIMYKDLARKKLPKLLHFQDASGMASGVEARVPFLDHRLVELVYSCSGNFIIKNGEGKYLVKKILRDKFGYVDKKATKHYVATPQREWLKCKDIYDSAMENVKYGELAKRGLINVVKFQEDYSRYAQSGELGNSYFIWKVLELEYFFKQACNKQA